MKQSNPFISNQEKPQLFFNRKKEITFILEIISQNKNLYIKSKNGIGKTSLIKRVLKKLNSNESYIAIYLDVKELIFSKNPTLELYHSILREFSEDNIKDFLNVQISDADQIDQLRAKLYEQIELLTSAGKKVIIAFDNFYVDREPGLKNQIKGIGSSINLLYISCFPKDDSIEAEVLVLNEFLQKEYEKFITKQFSKKKREISKKSVGLLFNVTRGDLSATNYICARIWELKSNKIKYELTKATIQNIISELKYSFQIAENLLSEYQLKLLKAISIEGNAKKITSKEFIEKYSLNAPSSVKTAVNSLLDKEIIYKAEYHYQVQDTLFDLYLSSRKF